jgi:hypothetical protein
VIQEIIPGNSIIVYDNDEANLLDFDNFIVDPENISYSQQIQSNTTNITELSSNINSISSIYAESLTKTALSSLSSDLITTVKTTSGTIVSNLASSSASLVTSLHETSSYSFTNFLPIAWAFFRSATAAVSETGYINLLSNVSPLCSSYAGNISAVNKVGTLSATCFNVLFCQPLDNTNYLVFGTVEKDDTRTYNLNTVSKTLSGFTYTIYKNTLSAEHIIDYTNLAIFKIF